MAEVELCITKTPALQKLQLCGCNKVQWNWAWYTKHKQLPADCQRDFWRYCIISCFCYPVKLNWALTCCIDWSPVTWEDKPGGAVISEIAWPLLVYNLEQSFGKWIVSFCNAVVKWKLLSLCLASFIKSFCVSFFVLNQRVCCSQGCLLEFPWCSASVLLVCLTKVSLHNSRYVFAMERSCLLSR